MLQKLIVKQFNGGISPYEKAGIPGSARFIRFLNIHADPHKMTLMPAPAKVTGSTVTGLVKWGVSALPHETAKFFVDANGDIYKEDNAGAWTLDRDGATIGDSAAGQGLEVFDDGLYYTSATRLGRKYPLSNSPSYNDNLIEDNATDVDEENIDSGQTYPVPTSIAETVAARQTINPTVEPIRAIRLYVVAKGTTADWTITVHDTANNVVATATLLNAAVSANAFNNFVLSSPWRPIVGNEYHFHVTVNNTTGGTTVQTGTASDLEDCNFKTLFSTLISDTSFHPIIEFLNGIAIGNGPYIAFWDRAIYEPNKVALRKGWTCRAFGRWREYLVALVIPTNTLENATYGRLYYWSGAEDAYDFFDEVSFGAPHCIYDQRNKLIGMYGTDGTLSLGNAPFQEVQPMPNVARGKRIEVNPGGITGWDGKTYFAVSNRTDDANFEQGIYEYGSKGDQLPEVINYVFKPSTGNNKATNISIGMVKGFGEYLYFSWKDNTTYGIDRVKMADNACALGEWESLIFDDDNPQKEKLFVKLKVTFEPLVANQTITPKYRCDKATSFTDGTAVSTVGATEAIFEPQELDKRFKEIEFGVKVASTDGSYPVITSIVLFFDDLREETDE